MKQKTGLSSVVLHLTRLETTRFTTQDGTKTYSLFEDSVYQEILFVQDSTKAYLLFEDGVHQEILVVKDNTKTYLLCVIKRSLLYVHDGWKRQTKTDQMPPITFSGHHLVTMINHYREGASFLTLILCKIWMFVTYILHICFGIESYKKSCHEKRRNSKFSFLFYSFQISKSFPKSPLGNFEPVK